MTQLASAAEIANGIVAYLQGSVVSDDLRTCRDERRFRTWVGQRVREWVRAQPGNPFTVKIEPDEGGVFPVREFGTSFWPDVSVESPASRTFLAVEIKCLGRKGLPGHVAQALGQSLLYKDPYEEVVAVFVLVDPLETDVIAAIGKKFAEHRIPIATVEPLRV